MAFRLLAKEEIERIKELQEDQGLAEPTDLTLCLGSSLYTKGFFTHKILSPTWLMPNSQGDAMATSKNGPYSEFFYNSVRGAVRPVIDHWKEVNAVLSRGVLKTTKKSFGKSISTITFGEYPQTIADMETSAKLENAFNNNVNTNLIATGKTYTFLDMYQDGGPLSLKSFQEYEYNNEKYIRIIARESHDFASGQKITAGDAYWIKVEPVEWILLNDMGEKYLVSEKCLFSSIPYDEMGNVHHNFESTYLCQYLDRYFTKEIDSTNTITPRAQNIPPVQQTAPAPKTQPVSHNPIVRKPLVIKTGTQKNINQSLTLENELTEGNDIQVSDEPMSIQEQVDFHIKNGLSFMLHGPSGVGKSRRIKDIDPDLTSLTLCNGILPEDVVGKIIYPDGVKKDDPSGGVRVNPAWYDELCRKCNEHPETQHVFFIDEVTNASETTQSLIYHIALEKSIAPGTGKLPDNAVVVLAGNNKEESGAAYNMPSPLFRRLSHIYLDLNLPDWLEWGSQKSKKATSDKERFNLHPLVASFVATYADKVFYSEYDEDSPPKHALDPRKWELLSDKIYENGGEIRREILEADIGPDATVSFLEYAKNPPLSLEEILEGDYQPSDIPVEEDARLALTLNLRHATPKQVKTVRQFIETYLGKENRALFDTLWVGDNDERAIQIATMELDGNLPQKTNLSSSSNKSQQHIEKYGIYINNTPMTIEEQMQFYIQNSMSFMLHGASGVGKSQRVKKIDPDLTSIVLCNGILPEDVIGKVIYPDGIKKGENPTGVWVPPAWYVELSRKCTQEPDKPHVFFIDEITNASETTQSLVYNIVLEKSIAPGMGKLPDNAVVVLAGNSKEESGAAYNMPAPLFRRLSHMYLDVDLPEWLKWGAQKSQKYPDEKNRYNIHPVVRSFLKENGKDAFYSKYDEDDPPKYALDPRKWEKVSDKIYHNNGLIRQELLQTDIGDELAKKFMIHARTYQASRNKYKKG